MEPSCMARLSIANLVREPQFVVLACLCIGLSTVFGYMLASKERRKASHTVAVVSDLFVYPIKGCRGIRVSSAELTPRGLAHDRMLMIVREVDGAMQTQRQLPKMATIRPLWNESGHLVLTAPLSPDFVLLTSDAGEGTERRAARVWNHAILDAIDCGDAVASWLSGTLLTPGLRLVRMPQQHKRPIPDYPDREDVVSFADGYPLLLVSETSLEAVRNLAELPSLAMERFRPNIVINGDGMNAFEENNWAKIAVGGAFFKSPKPCVRCQVPRIDPSTGTPNSLLNMQPTNALKSLTKNHFGLNLIPMTTDLSVHIGDRVRIYDKSDRGLRIG